jgi:hypothetical protein
VDKWRGRSGGISPRGEAFHRTLPPQGGNKRACLRGNAGIAGFEERSSYTLFWNCLQLIELSRQKNPENIQTSEVEGLKQLQRYWGDWGQ